MIAASCRRIIRRTSGRDSTGVAVNFGRVKEGGSDAEVLEWCFRTGRRPGASEIFMWNEYLRKCGWNDDYAERLRTRLEGLGLAGRTDIQTLFDLIEVDEGRPPGGAAAAG